MQETWLRYAGALADPTRAEIRTWALAHHRLGRICLDVLRSARVRREAYPGQWLPEPLVSRGRPVARTASPPTRPTGRSGRTRSAWPCWSCWNGSAPEQRVAFVLHDVFAVPFDEVAGAGHHRGAARQLASRARRAVAVAGRPPAHRRPGRAAPGAGAFVAADRVRRPGRAAPGARAGRGARSATAAGYSRRPGGRSLGATPVARFLLGLFGRPAGSPTRCVARAGAGQRRARPAAGDRRTRRPADPPGHRVRRGRRPDHRALQPAQPGEARPADPAPTCQPPPGPPPARPGWTRRRWRSTPRPGRSVGAPGTTAAGSDHQGQPLAVGGGERLGAVAQRAEPARPPPRASATTSSG